MAFRVGQRLELDFQELKCWTTLRGWVPHRALLVDLPEPAGRKGLIQKGMPCTARWVENKEICSFRSQVVQLISGEASLICLAYPEEIQTQRLRSELRARTFFSVWITDASGKGAPATVMDLSRKGCLIESPEVSPELGETLVLWGVLPNGVLFLDVACRVRRVQPLSQLGLEFEGLNSDQERGLEDFLHSLPRSKTKPFALQEPGRKTIGDLSIVPLVYLSRAVGVSGKNYLIDVWDEPRTGKIYFHEGEVIHAVVGPLRGIPAFREMLRWKKGQFGLSVWKTPPPRNVFGPLSRLLEGAPRPVGDGLGLHLSGETL